MTWRPKYEWERYDRVSYGDDLRPGKEGHKLREIRERASIGADEEGFPVTFVEVLYSPHICDECPQECGYIITHAPDTPEQEVLCEDGFETINDAREAATQAVAAILQRTA